MAKKVTNKGLVDDNLFKTAKENTDAWIKSLEVLEASLKDVSKVQKGILKASNDAQAKGIKQITTATKTLLQVEKHLSLIHI